jgi:hypothetical protein
VTAARLPGEGSGRFSPPVGLWCPWCRSPFVGSVDRATGRFAHGECPVAVLDVARLEALARDSWFWDRFLDRVGGTEGRTEPAT